MIHRTGLWTIRFLMLSLLVTPLIRSARYPKLIAVRRMVGVAAFAYAAAHLTPVRRRPALRPRPCGERDRAALLSDDRLRRVAGACFAGRDLDRRDDPPPRAEMADAAFAGLRDRGAGALAFHDPGEGRRDRTRHHDRPLPRPHAVPGRAEARRAGLGGGADRRGAFAAADRADRGGLVWARPSHPVLGGSQRQHRPRHGVPTLGLCAGGRRGALRRGAGSPGAGGGPRRPRPSPRRAEPVRT